MPKFKHKENGNIVECSEDHASQVLRKQSGYTEITCSNNQKIDKESPTLSKKTEIDKEPAKRRGRPPKKSESS